MCDGSQLLDEVSDVCRVVREQALSSHGFTSEVEAQDRVVGERLLKDCELVGDVGDGERTVRLGEVYVYRQGVHSDI